jgi:hypothetical protein
MVIWPSTLKVQTFKFWFIAHKTIQLFTTAQALSIDCCLQTLECVCKSSKLRDSREALQRDSINFYLSMSSKVFVHLHVTLRNVATILSEARVLGAIILSDASSSSISIIMCYGLGLRQGLSTWPAGQALSGSWSQGGHCHRLFTSHSPQDRRRRRLDSGRQAAPLHPAA